MFTSYTDARMYNLQIIDTEFVFQTVPYKDETD